MSAHVIPLRPSPRPRNVPPVPCPRPVPSWPSPPVPAGEPPVSVEWDGIGGLHTAHCARCAESFTSASFDQVEHWTDTHRCDPELAALLAEITNGRAA